MPGINWTKATTSSFPSVVRPTTADCTTSLCEFRTGFDFRGIDVESGTDDHFLGAADDIKAIAIEAREIPGVEPALAIDSSRREVRCAVIAAHHVTPADMKLADLASRHRYAVYRSDAGLDARQQRADGLILTRGVESNAGYSGRAFRNAVTV